MAKVESKAHKLLRKQSIAFLIAVIAVCSFLILLGANLEEDAPIWSRLLIVLGSSGLGTCFGLVFGSWTKASAVERIKELVEESLSSPFSASDTDLDEFRRVWHHYLLTKMDGRRVWRYRTFDFSRVSVPGKLVTVFAVLGPDGEKHTYQIQAFLSPPRLIFVQKATTGTEPPIIHVYPVATERFRSVHAGIAILQSWDGDHLCVPVLMCAQPLSLSSPICEEGNVPDALVAELDKVWSTKASGLRLQLESLAP